MVQLKEGYLHTVHRGRLYREVSRGISPDFPLSPLIGAFYSKELEQHPDRIFIGRIEKGFDLIDYRFSEATKVDVQNDEKLRGTASPAL